MANNDTEQVEVNLSDVDRIWQLFYDGLRQGKITKQTGLSLALVRAVIHGRYSIDGGKVVMHDR